MHGTTSPRTSPIPAHIEQATEMYAGGLSLVRVGKRFGCDGREDTPALPTERVVNWEERYKDGGPDAAHSEAGMPGRLMAYQPSCSFELHSVT